MNFMILVEWKKDEAKRGRGNAGHCYSSALNSAVSDT